MKRKSRCSVELGAPRHELFCSGVLGKGTELQGWYSLTCVPQPTMCCSPHDSRASGNEDHLHDDRVGVVVWYGPPSVTPPSSSSFVSLDFGGFFLFSLCSCPLSPHLLFCVQIQHQQGLNFDVVVHGGDNLETEFVCATLICVTLTSKANAQFGSPIYSKQISCLYNK